MSDQSDVMIWWVRRDIRLKSHPILEEAARNARQVLPVFIIDPRLMGSLRSSPRRNDYLKASLLSLDGELKKRRSGLIVRTGSPTTVLRLLVEQTNAKEVVALRDYSAHDSERSEQVSTAVNFRQVKGQSVIEDPVVKRPDGHPYSVFSAYFRSWQGLFLPKPQAFKSRDPVFYDVKDLHSEHLQTRVNSIQFPVGEMLAQRRVQRFLRTNSHGYENERNLLDGSGSSQISPYLKFGVLDPKVLAEQAEIAGAFSWLRQLAWRDYYFSVLQQYPRLAKENLRRSFDQFPWRNSVSDFRKWVAGETGYPIVDAGMRQLMTEGWVSNRMRMILASFLTKHLLIDWRKGEVYFSQQLIDGDLASNAGGWQWVAGTGTDAAPFFRIFNPTSQSKRFGPDGSYIAKWLPELRHLDRRWIHEPWKSPFPPRNYPPPIVDHDFARLRALDAYQGMRKKS